MSRYEDIFYWFANDKFIGTNLIGVCKHNSTVVLLYAVTKTIVFIAIVAYHLYLAFLSSKLKIYWMNKKEQIFCIQFESTQCYVYKYRTQFKMALKIKTLFANGSFSFYHHMSRSVVQSSLVSDNIRQIFTL